MLALTCVCVSVCVFMCSALRCDDAGENVEIRRESLASALRVVDDDIDVSARRQSKSHRHAVVIVRVNIHIRLHLRWRIQLLGRSDDAIVRAFEHIATQLAKFGANSNHALRLLNAPARNVTNSSHTISKESSNGKSHRCIRHGIHVNINRLERTLRTGAGDGVWTPFQRGAHLFHGVRKFSIPLDAFRTAANDRDSATSDGRAREEIRSRRRIAFNERAARRDVLLATLNLKVLEVSRALHLHAKSFHERNSHLNVRLGDELIDNNNFDRTSGERRRHEECREILRADRAAELNAAAR
mmetsp:Transcript_156/g.657  ORF Transcript_156/g.657 Transcript_156/m.657 type:complete len:299 (+) Transcript_156:80-976(+)